MLIGDENKAISFNVTTDKIAVCFYEKRQQRFGKDKTEAIYGTLTMEEAKSLSLWLEQIIKGDK